MAKAGRDRFYFRPELKPGDEIRIVAPARSMAMIDQSIQDLARSRLQAMGL